MGLMYPRIHGLMTGTQIACPTLSNGLINKYEFEDSGNLGFDSQLLLDLTNINGVTQVAGIIGSGAYLDNSNLSYLIGTGVPDLTDFSLSVWLRPDETWFNSLSSFDTEWVVGLINVSNQTVARIEFGNIDLVGGMAFEFRIDDAGSTQLFASPDSQIFPVTFLAVLTFDGSVLKPYIRGSSVTWFNGNDENTAPLANPVVGATTQLSIGKTTATLSPPTTMVDQVVLWDRALTLEEVDCLYNSGNGVVI
jgi:hypothetical protein